MNVSALQTMGGLYFLLYQSSTLTLIVYSRFSFQFILSWFFLRWISFLNFNFFNAKKSENNFLVRSDLCPSALLMPSPCVSSLFPNETNKMNNVMLYKNMCMGGTGRVIRFVREGVCRVVHGRGYYSFRKLCKGAELNFGYSTCNNNDKAE